MERLLEYFVPEKYLLNIAIDKYAKTIGGVVVVLGESLKKTVKFHAVGLKIKDVVVNGKKVKFEVKDEMLALMGVPLGKIEVAIRYDGKLTKNMEGAYLSTYEYEGKTETIVATQFESHFARRAFPCIDEPAAKAVFELSISVPEDSEDLILSNMPVIETSSVMCSENAASRTILLQEDLGRLSATNFRAVSFEPTPRMSTYLLAFVIGRFHGKTIKNEHGVEITSYCALNQDIDTVDFANEVAARSLEFYDDNFGVPYPLKKLDQVALPDFEAGAMENWGLVTYRESMMLAGKNATLGTRKSVAVTVAHELSHQWFGDLVTMRWWDDLWLNESFATVMEYYAVDSIYPEFNIFESFFTSDACAALNRDAYSGVQSVHQEIESPEEIATLFDPAIVYAKGARLMLMLIRLMGWEKFCEGLKDYFKKHQYQNTIGDDLWGALTPYADFDPKALMHAFIDKPGYPVITSEADTFDRFSQKRFLLDGPCVDDSWPIPEVIEDMSGHYILDLTDAEFSERLDNFENLGIEEKLRLLIDRDLITKAGLRSAASLVPLALKFGHENSAAVWSKLAALVGNLKLYVDDESLEEKTLKRYVGRLIEGKINEIGLVTKEGDDDNMLRLRSTLLALDYYAEDEKRIKELADMYNDDYNKMDAEIRSDILSAKIYLEPDAVKMFIEKYQEIADPEVKFDYLAATTLVKDKKELKRLIGLLGENDMVKPQDQLYLFLWLYRNHLSRKDVFDWLVDNWEIVKRISGDSSLDDYPVYIARLARTEAELDKYRDFFGPMKSEKGLKRAIEIGEREIEARLKLIKQNKLSVYKALAGF